jgi:hypothetical protein
LAKNCQKIWSKSWQKVGKKLAKKCQKVAKSCQKVVIKVVKKWSKSCQKVAKSCQKVVKKFKIQQTVVGWGVWWVGGNSSSKAFGISFADSPKAKSSNEMNSKNLSSGMQLLLYGFEKCMGKARFGSFSFLD